jgi:hypothetical protein
MSREHKLNNIKGESHPLPLFGRDNMAKDEFKNETKDESKEVPEKKYKYRMTHPSKVKERFVNGWRRGCTLAEKRRFGDKRYMGTENVLMKKEVA